MITDSKIIDGKAIAEKIRLSIRKEIVSSDVIPNLAVILVGDDAASHTYIRLKEKACNEVGIQLDKYIFKAFEKEENILETINFLNKDSEVGAILVQLPLPKKFNTDKIISSIDPKKDVDGFHRENVEKFLSDKEYIKPVMTQAIIKLLEETGQDLKGKTATILGNSHEFIAPIEHALKNLGINASHSHTLENDWQEKTKNSDILITAVGKAFIIDEEHIKKDAIIIDIGINKLKDFIVGDVNYTEVFPKCSFITPVPGGVGPMTIAYLLKNTLELYKKNHSV